MHAIIGIKERNPARALYSRIKDMLRTFDGFELCIKFMLEIA